MAVKVDITARIQGEAKLKDTLEQLQKTTAFQRAILDSAPYAIVATQADGTITMFNAGAERMLGYRAEEVVGKLKPDVFHNGNEIIERARALTAELGFPIEPPSEAFIAKARLGQPSESQWTYIRKDGTQFPGQLSLSPIRDDAGQITGFMGTTQDITERKRAEEALSASEHGYRLLAENMRDVVWTVDMNMNRTYVSSSIEFLTGYSVDEALQQSYDQVLTADSAKHTREVFRRILVEARENPTILSQPVCHEMEYRCKNGGTIWAEANMTWLRAEDGSLVGGIGVSRDITARKKAAQELREYCAQTGAC